MRNHQYLFILLVVSLLFPNLTWGQDEIESDSTIVDTIETIEPVEPTKIEEAEEIIEQDLLSPKIMEILSVLEDEEKKDIIVIARSQKKRTAEEELTWLLSGLNKPQKERVLKFLKAKAGSRIKADDGVAEIYWIEDVYNFGIVREGKIIKHIFEFENIGKVPYIIEDVEGSCGCTIPSYTTEPIPPGGKGRIMVTFNSKGKVGENTEFITIKGNSHPSSVSLMIEGRVY